MESLLINKGVIKEATLDSIVDYYQNQVGPINGAKIVAKAWDEPDFERVLIQKPTTTITNMGFGGRQGEHMVVLKNTRNIHNLVVCTLCSCYPWPLLGLPPSWYKSDSYRSRAVREPRKVLSEFGVQLSKETSVKVWDSTAEIRYLVIPERPYGTEGWSQEELCKIITRDSMIGTDLLKVNQ